MNRFSSRFRKACPAAALLVAAVSVSACGPAYEPYPSEVAYTPAEYYAPSYAPAYAPGYYYDRGYYYAPRSSSPYYSRPEYEGYYED